MDSGEEGIGEWRGQEGEKKGWEGNGGSRE